MNAYRHEFLWLLRRKAVIGVVIVAALAGSFGYVTISTTSVEVSGSGFWFFSGGTYHLKLWTHDNAGSPVSGIEVGLFVDKPNATSPFLPPTAVVSQTARSDDTGALRFDFALPNLPKSNGSGGGGSSSGFEGALSGSDPGFPSASFGGAFGAGFPIGNATGATPQPLGGPVAEVARGFYDGLGRLLVTWAGQGGALPTGDSAVACTVPFPSSNASGIYSSPPSNCTGAWGTERLGTLTGYSTLLPLPTLVTAFSNGSRVVEFLQILGPSGAVVYQTSGGEQFGNPPCSPQCLPVAAFFSQSTPGPGLLSGYALELSLFLPLMALLLAYWSYARPRLSGTLEPVLARPVTRAGLFLTRYGTVALALVAASAGEVLLLDAGLTVLLREPLPWPMIAPLVAGYAVATVGFAGLVFLMAHSFRSTGPVLGIGIALLLLFSIFWIDVIGALVYLAGPGAYATSSYSAIYLRSQLAAPPQFPAVVTGTLTNVASDGTLLGYVASGVSALVIVAAAVAWIALPLLGAFWRAVYWD